MSASETNKESNNLEAQSVEKSNNANTTAEQPLSSTQENQKQTSNDKPYNKKKSVLFVCLGNICRSPTCEGICRLISNGEVDAQSASTSSWHRNECPDERSQEICQKHGIDISGHRARAIRNDDWEYFDVIAALDQKVLETLSGMRPQNSTAKLLLFNAPDGVGDPYYGGRTGFQKMFQQIYNAMGDFLKDNGLVKEISNRF